MTPSRYILIVAIALGAALLPAQERWTKERANAWYDKQPWLVGANYAPANAINQLEMWQADTFDPKQIDKELSWAADIGMNTMRVFLHDLPWQQDSEAYRERIDQFLAICAKHRIRPMLVLFDSVWDPHPKLGKQRPPRPGIHNSGWVQGPGADALADPKQETRLRAYVTGVVGAFANDSRVLAWDIWNEPDNPVNQYGNGKVVPPNKIELVIALIPKVFQWARDAKPSQPLTAGVWMHVWDNDTKLTPMEKIQVEESDVISFHDYNDPAMFEQRIRSLQRLGRPILCTEYMARGNKSTFEGSLPVAMRYRVAAYNWGLVQGKTQTHLPWDSWEKPYVNGREPAVWFHEVFRTDGTPYRTAETELIRRLTSEVNSSSAPR